MRDERGLGAGKLPAPLLERLLKKYTSRKGRGLVLGPGIGLDAAVIDFTGGYLLAKTDPVTLVEGDAGRYAIHVNANDIAVMGGVPRWFLATILLPEKGTSAVDAETIFRDLKDACDDLGVRLCGGHTEVTPTVNSPVIIGQMLGEVARDALVTTAGARTGDALILTEALAIEGTSIIARTLGDKLIQDGSFSRTFITRCGRLLDKPGISVVRAARAAMRTGAVHAMHDPTEGGLASALHEMSSASGRKIEIDHEAVPILTSTKKLCARLGLEPLGLIASGSLLIAAPESKAKGLTRGLRKEGIPASIIGRVGSRGNGVRITQKGSSTPLPLPERDEITKISGPLRPVHGP